MPVGIRHPCTMSEAAHSVRQVPYVGGQLYQDDVLKSTFRVK